MQKTGLSICLVFVLVCCGQSEGGIISELNGGTDNNTLEDECANTPIFRLGTMFGGFDLSEVDFDWSVTEGRSYFGISELNIGVWIDSSISPLIIRMGTMSLSSIVIDTNFLLYRHMEFTETNGVSIILGLSETMGPPFYDSRHGLYAVAYNPDPDIAPGGEALLNHEEFLFNQLYIPCEKTEFEATLSELPENTTLPLLR